MSFVFLLGGARSGKSALAVEMALRSGAPVTLIATAERGDEEMEERIARHRATRPAGWTTIEEPVGLAEAVRAAPLGEFVIIDCLTLWVSNLFGAGDSDQMILVAAGVVASLLAHRHSPAVVVSNEVGLGIVPANQLARRFRDTLGAVNVTFAEHADRTAFLVAGRVQELSPATEFLESVTWQAPPPAST